MSDICKVRSDADIAAVTALVWEFFDFLRVRYPERRELLEKYIEMQDVAGMLADFRTHFNPPAGECFLAALDGAPVGTVMVRPERPGCAELNRMYVAPAGRRRGLGRRLAQAVIDEARALGYGELRLGALDRHVEALPLYRSLGFQPDPNPPEYARLDPGILTFRMTL